MEQSYCFIKEIKTSFSCITTLSEIHTFKSSFEATWKKRLYFFKSEDFKIINESNVFHLEIKLGLRHNTLDSRTEGVMIAMGTSSTHVYLSLSLAFVFQ